MSIHAHASAVVSRRAFLAGAALLSLAGCSAERFAEQHVGEKSAAFAAADGCILNGYSWNELADISQQIAGAPDDEAARMIASEAGLLSDDGLIDVSQQKYLELSDGTPSAVRLIGMRSDIPAGGGISGLTFQFSYALAERGVTEDSLLDGGWADCSLRTWLNGAALELLPDDLVSVLRAVEKQTVCELGKKPRKTTDVLWLLSESELAGSEYLLAHYADAEGMQGEGSPYQLFSQASASQPLADAAFKRMDGPTGSWICWWERTLAADGSTYVYRSYGGSHSEDIAYSPNFALGVAPGFCL